MDLQWIQRLFFLTPHCIQNKRDNKILKVAAIFDILEFCMEKQINLIQIVMLNYPLQKEEFVLHIDGQDTTFGVSFKPL